MSAMHHSASPTHSPSHPLHSASGPPHLDSRRSKKALASPPGLPPPGPPAKIKYHPAYLLDLKPKCLALPPGLHLPDHLKTRTPARSPPSPTSGPRRAPEEPWDVRYKKSAMALLNKLTPDNFESISEKLVQLLNEHFDIDQLVEKYTLLVDLLFEKAIREPNFSDCFSGLCLYVSSRTPAIHVSSGPPLSFKRLLLERCKEEFETKHHIPEAAPEADIHTKIAVDEARNKLKQRSLGVPKFIGSLFLSGLAPEAIVHCCLVTLLTNPDESDLINFEALMTTIGKRIDQPKAEKLMEAYFAKVEDYSKHPAFSSRIRFKLLDLLDLRKHKWEPKRPLAKPKTIEEVHKDVQEEKEMKIKEMRNLAMRVEEREEDDGWVPPPARGAEGRPPLSALLRKVPSSPPAVPERPAAVPAGLPACRASGRAHPERSAAVPVPATVGRPPNRQNHHRKHHNYKQNQRTQTHIT